MESLEKDLLDQLDLYDNEKGRYSLIEFLSEHGYTGIGENRLKKLSVEIENYLDTQKDINAPWLVNDLCKVVVRVLEFNNHLSI